MAKWVKDTRETVIEWFYTFDSDTYGPNQVCAGEDEQFMREDYAIAVANGDATSELQSREIPNPNYRFKYV